MQLQQVHSCLFPSNRERETKCKTTRRRDDKATTRHSTKRNHNTTLRYTRVATSRHMSRFGFREIHIHSHNSCSGCCSSSCVLSKLVIELSSGKITKACTHTRRETNTRLPQHNFEVQTSPRDAKGRAKKKNGARVRVPLVFTDQRLPNHPIGYGLPDNNPSPSLLLI